MTEKSVMVPRSGSSWYWVGKNHIEALRRGHERERAGAVRTLANPVLLDGIECRVAWLEVSAHTAAFYQNKGQVYPVGLGTILPPSVGTTQARAIKKVLAAIQNVVTKEALYG